jgi:hypothetical protein
MKLLCPRIHFAPRVDCQGSSVELFIADSCGFLQGHPARLAAIRFATSPLSQIPSFLRIFQRAPGDFRKAQKIAIILPKLSGAAMQKTIIILLLVPFSAHAGDLAQNNTYTFCINQSPSAHDCYVVQSNRDCGDSSYNSGDGSYGKASQSYSTSAAACAAARGSDACRDGFRC